MLGAGQALREDRQIHRELQGTRILRSSRATPTDVIIINTFILNYTMCRRGMRRGAEKMTEEEVHRGMRVEKTNWMSTAVRVRV